MLPSRTIERHLKKAMNRQKLWLALDCSEGQFDLSGLDTSRSLHTDEMTQLHKFVEGRPEYLFGANRALAGAVDVQYDRHER